MPYDRNEVLDRTDLRELADQLAGPHKGRGAGATWPCPAPGHGTQTGKTPPVSIFRTSYGDERWKCHSCGAGGTAIDLVMTTQGLPFPEAIELLARRAGVVTVDDSMPRLSTARIERPPPVPSACPSPEIERFVAAAEAYLWSDRGRPMRQWLADRGLGDEVVRANRLGADPGPARLERPRGLPRGGPAVVLPVLGSDGSAVYFQARYLKPRDHKYENPSAALAGSLPRVTEVLPPRPAGDPSVVVITEGIPDALVAAQAGYRAAAVLGAGVPDERAARAIAERLPTEHLVVAFDADAAGRAGAHRLEELLAVSSSGRVSVLEVPGHLGDLNGWQLHAGAAFDQQLGEAVAEAIPSSRGSVNLSGAPEYLGPRGDVARESAIAGGGTLDPATIPSVGQSSPPTPAERLVAEIETILYHHVLVDDAGQATRNLRQIESTIEGWSSSESGPRSGLTPTSESTALDQRLEQLWYDHFLGDTPAAAGSAIDTLRGTVREWSSDLASDSVGRDGGDLLADPGAQLWATDHGLAPELALDAVALGGPAFDI